MLRHFNKALISTRTIAGYKTAYAFYHINGGRRVFPFTYAYYLKIERGNSLPRPEWLALIILTMRICGGSQKALLVSSYLKDLAGTSYDDLFAPFLFKPEESPLQTSLRRLRGRLAEHLTPRQFLALAASPEAYGCFLVLDSTKDAMHARDLAESIGASEKACEAALCDLARAGLVLSTHNGLHRIPHPGRHFTHPNDPASLNKNRDLEAHTDKLFTRAGLVTYNGRVSARLSHRDAESAISALKGVFQVVASNDVPTKADPDADLYLIESRMRKLVGARRMADGQPRDARVPRQALPT